jgi:hypothetical protein
LNASVSRIRFKPPLIPPGRCRGSFLIHSRQIKWLQNTYRTDSVCS